MDVEAREQNLGVDSASTLWVLGIKFRLLGLLSKHLYLLRLSHAFDKPGVGSQGLCKLERAVELR